MNKKNLIQELSDVSLAMFRKNFFGIFHGSISTKFEQNKILINKSDAIFDKLANDGLIELCLKRDYRWNEASIDADIHFHIYQSINEAKYICYAMPPFITSYTLSNDIITPKDYFGLQRFGQIKVYEPNNFEDWYERARVEIPRFMKDNKTNIILIRGYGVYAYDRRIREIAKSIAILENSCRLLHYAQQHNLQLTNKD
ncbi:MAG: class II aldolase and adducin N-terminal domain-containing protein [Campylobacteraceae bacterium]|nr:class II aldolase and adducin N-terminal domain-containing protein [Campylobacteraceae bacterium]